MGESDSAVANHARDDVFQVANDVEGSSLHALRFSSIVYLASSLLSTPLTYPAWPIIRHMTSFAIKGKARSIISSLGSINLMRSSGGLSLLLNAASLLLQWTAINIVRLLWLKHVIMCMDRYSQQARLFLDLLVVLVAKDDIIIQRTEILFEAQKGKWLAMSYIIQVKNVKWGVTAWVRREDKKSKSHMGLAL